MRILQRKRNSLLMFVLGVVIMLALAAPTKVTAQVSVSTGGITGTITDPQGAVVGGAKVTISDAGAGISKATITDSTGYFTFGALAPGAYAVKVEATNFKTYQTSLVPPRRSWRLPVQLFL